MPATLQTQKWSESPSGEPSIVEIKPLPSIWKNPGLGCNSHSPEKTPENPSGTIVASPSE